MGEFVPVFAECIEVSSSVAAAELFEGESSVGLGIEVREDPACADSIPSLTTPKPWCLGSLLRHDQGHQSTVIACVHSMRLVDVVVIELTKCEAGVPLQGPLNIHSRLTVATLSSWALLKASPWTQHTQLEKLCVSCRTAYYRLT